jgi:hypothetical protein
MSWARWVLREEGTAATARQRLVRDSPREFIDANLIGARSTSVTCYSNHQLIEFKLTTDPGLGLAFILDGPDGTRYFDGNPMPYMRRSAPI